MTSSLKRVLACLALCSGCWFTNVRADGDLLPPGAAAQAADAGHAWAQAMAGHIGDHWLMPPGLPAGLRCRVQFELQTDGTVLGVTVVQGSGNPAFDASVVAAIHAASPLPLPADPKIFRRLILAPFTPESLAGARSR